MCGQVIAGRLVASSLTTVPPRSELIGYSDITDITNGALCPVIVNSEFISYELAMKKGTRKRGWEGGSKVGSFFKDWKVQHIGLNV